jgi:hypothetical protein
MYEVVDVKKNYSHGSFETMSEARSAVTRDGLDNWAIYGPLGGICEWSREPGVYIAPTNPNAPLAAIRVADKLVEGMLTRG